MKIGKKMVAVGSLTALCALFMTTAGTMSASDVRAQDIPHDLKTPAPAATTPAAPLYAPQRWNVEFEAEMRRDIEALTSFVVNELGPVAAQVPEQALLVESIRGFDQALHGCYGSAGVADYAWALNHTLDEALPLFTMLEVMAEREENFPTGPDSEARLKKYHALMEKFEQHYTRAARWLWDVNAAFGVTYPDAGEQVELLREQGKIEGDSHNRAGADSYTGSYPFALTTPLRNRAAIFGPYVTRRPALSAPSVCP